MNLKQGRSCPVLIRKAAVISNDFKLKSPDLDAQSIGLDNLSDGYRADNIVMQRAILINFISSS